MPHSPQHFQAARLVEPITGINERCSDRLRFLSEKLKGSQCPLSLPSLILSIAPPVLLYLHLLWGPSKYGLKALYRVLLCYPHLYV